MRLFYSAEAVADLSRLRSFIAEKNPMAAARIARNLKTQIEKLRDFPKLGRPVLLSPDPENMRDLITGAYIIRYQLLPDRLLILRVWHHREDRSSSE